MKILFFAPYIYDLNHNEFTRTSSGFGYMVNDILKEVSKLQETYLLTHQFTKGYKESYIACRHTKLDFIKHIQLRDVYCGLKFFFSSKVPFKNRIRYVYYYLNRGSIEFCFKKINPDIIHIHGLTFQTKPIVELCKKQGYKYIVTLHGLNGLNESVNLPQIEKDYEYLALRELEKDRIITTVVSSGVKKNIMSMYQLSGEHIVVILNGTHVKKVNINNKVCKDKKSKKYHILCIGTVEECKNQMQLLRACALLPEETKRKLEVHIIGGKSENIDIDKEIKMLQINQVVTYHGFIERKKIAKMWSEADLNAVMSKSEGFGLSIIEGFVYGVPTITFSDLDAVHDLYDEKAIMLIHKRDDKAVAEALVEALERTWDYHYIMNLVQKYSMENIGKQYNEIYMKVH